MKIFCWQVVKDIWSMSGLLQSNKEAGQFSGLYALVQRVMFSFDKNAKLIL